MGASLDGGDSDQHRPLRGFDGTGADADACPLAGLPLSQPLQQLDLPGVVDVVKGGAANETPLGRTECGPRRERCDRFAQQAVLLLEQPQIPPSRPHRRAPQARGAGTSWCQPAQTSRACPPTSRRRATYFQRRSEPLLPRCCGGPAPGARRRRPRSHRAGRRAGWDRATPSGCRPRRWPREGASSAA